MKVEWTEHAKRQRDQIAEYIRQQFGVKRKTQFLQEVRRTTKTIRSSPGVGTIDSLYNDRPTTYRSVIINGLNKMVYRVDNDTIYIVAFWDTRREPIYQASQTE